MSAQEQKPNPENSNSPDSPTDSGVSGQIRPRDNPPDTHPDTKTPLPPEYGGRKGPEATRYGDWEMDGKCVDF